MTQIVSLLGYTAGQYILAEAIAVGARGAGPTSLPSDNTIQAQIIPQASPGSFSATSTASTITLTWATLTTGVSTGYSPLTGYKIYDKTSGVESLVTTISSASTLTYTLTSLTPAGNTFTYTISSLNIHGESTSRSTVSIVLAGPPSQGSPPTISQSGKTVTIAWTPPTTNGAVITAYTVLLLDMNDGVYREYPSLCNGTAALNANSTNPSCAIQMSSFTSTLKYTIGTYIRAEFTATNSKGTSPISNPSTGTIVAQSAPTIAVSGLSATSTITTITLSWTALTSDANIGYSAITGYLITNDNGTPSDNSDDTTTTVASTSNTFSGLTTGTSYTFTVAAINVQGTGPASNSFSFVAADVPGQMDKVVVSQTAGSTQVTFKWTQPSALNGLPVTSYKLLFYQPNQSPAGYYENTSLCNAGSDPAFSAMQ